MPHKILVADDNHDTIMILSTILEREGYRVITAADGLEAIRCALEEKPALILVDIMMPKKSGFEVCKALKENPDTKEIPVLIITAKTDPVSRKDGFDLGACEYIIKPLNPRQLLQKVKEHLPPGETFPPSGIAAAVLGLAPLFWKAVRALGSPFYFHPFGFSRILPRILR
jgi:DNA-binding response OmpR family regulator